MERNQESPTQSSRQTTSSGTNPATNKPHIPKRRIYDTEEKFRYFISTPSFTPVDPTECSVVFYQGPELDPTSGGSLLLRIRREGQEINLDQVVDDWIHMKRKIQEMLNDDPESPILKQLGIQATPDREERTPVTRRLE